MEPTLVTIAVATLSTLVLAAAVIGWGTARVARPGTIDLWARRHSLVVTSGNRPLIRWYVTLAGTLRITGAVSGAIIGSLADRAFGIDTTAGAGFWMWVVAGWMSGGWWAWRQVAAMAPPGVGARLVPRRLADYAPLAARWGPPVGGCVLAATALGTAAVDGRTTWTAVALVAAVAIPPLSLRAARSVVDRRQSAVGEDLVAADDAIRSATVHLVGAGACAGLLLAAVALWQATVDPAHPLPYGLRGWVPAVLLLGAYLTGTYLANRPWRVRRGPLAGHPA